MKVEKVVIYHDQQDPRNQGWAYRSYDSAGKEIESGELGDINGTEADAFADAKIQFLGAEIVIA